MSDKTGIEWTDATWNPVRGCSLVSDGCKHCYAMGVAGRFGGPGQPYDGLTIKTSQGAKWSGKIMLVPAMLTQPIKWQRPRKIFVNSMSDLFHEGVPDSYIDQVFAAMALAPHHTFQVLTKRPERMRDYLNAPDRAEAIGWAELRIFEGHGKLPAGAYHGPNHRHETWPLPNVWLGVSVEDQAAANERIPALLQTPAAVRWLSMEPLLGPVSFRWAAWVNQSEMEAQRGSTSHLDGLRGIDWVVVGAESGPKARPMHPLWARSLRDQCAEAGVPFLFKQWGEWAPTERADDSLVVHGQSKFSDNPPFHDFKDGETMARIGKKAAGRTLDGKLHDGYPGETA